MVINGNGVSQVGCGGIYYSRKPEGASRLRATPSQVSASDEQPEASNAACDYPAGPEPWKNWLAPREHSGSCKGGVGAVLQL